MTTSTLSTELGLSTDDPMYTYLVSRRRVSALAHTRTLAIAGGPVEVPVTPAELGQQGWADAAQPSPKTRFGVRLQCSSLVEFAPLAIAFGLPWFRRLIFGVFISLIILVRFGMGEKKVADGVFALCTSSRLSLLM